jgi:hypothetical protein
MSLLHCPAWDYRIPYVDVRPDGAATCPLCRGIVDGPLARREESDPTVAMRKALPPGVALMVVGVLWALGGLVLSVICAIAVMVGGIPRDEFGQGMFLVLLVAPAIIGSIVFTAGGLMALGGLHLIRMSSRRLALAGSMAAIAAGVLGCGLCVAALLLVNEIAVLGVPVSAGLPIGIWALVVLNHPNVKSAFR